MSPAEKLTTAYIYAFGSENGPTKIGHSLDTAKRMKQLSAQHGRKLTVTGTWPLGYGIALAVERYVHWLLREHHISGEWFNVSREEVFAAIDKAFKEDVDPDYPLPPLDAIARGWGKGEHITTKFPIGTRERLRNVVGAKHHGEFVRQTIDAELARREKAS